MWVWEGGIGCVWGEEGIACVGGGGDLALCNVNLHVHTPFAPPSFPLPYNMCKK